ncbi:MAG: response regulator transcription factor [Saprospiraceae bacterium]|nr:response regulator transcription factor [Saprospiraceae bacterium]MBK8545835.1 response regulator transcription factor [Saprospiraceae bacterium]MBK8819604.1 response regulator transcription factor [Saprospiraceae bacterium]MBK9045095.1 response regulator transcription factor [Saprospiraceae bacterium]
MIKICIADDHQLVAEGIKLLLSEYENLDMVASFQNGRVLLDFLNQGHHIDVVFLDINMPELNGIETCKRIKNDFPDIKVIALSMIGENNLIKLMFKSGADAYLHKNAAKEEIILAIQEVMLGKKYLSQEMTNQVLFNDQSNHSAKIVNSPFPKLSDREIQILTMIVGEKTTQEIAENLFISFGTVETHRRNIMTKLGAKNTAGMVRTALEYNLLSPDK